MSSQKALNFLKRFDVLKNSTAGVATPDHVIRLKAHPLYLNKQDINEVRNSIQSKINLFVKNATLDDNSLSIKVFEEKLIDDIWVKSDRNKDLELKIQKSILDTARKLKIASENL